MKHVKVALLITSPGYNNLAFEQLANDLRLLAQIQQLQSEAIRSHMEFAPGSSF
jgi:hypothetical protein